MRLYSCGSNGSGQLALGDDDDRSTLNSCLFDPSIDADALRGAEIVDIASSAHHSLLLLRFPTDSPSHGVSAYDLNTPGSSTGTGWRYELYGVGTNSYGQLGRKCALRDEDAPPQSWSSFRRLNLRMRGMGAEWEPRRIGATWTTSFVVYRRSLATAGSSSSLSSSSTAGGMEEILVAAGSNDFGELGFAPPVQNHHGDAELEEPVAGPVVVDLGLQYGESITSVCCGQRHVMCLLEDTRGAQRVVGWGASRKGELDPSSIPSLIATAVIDKTYTDTDMQARSGKATSKARATRRPPSSTPHTLPLSLTSAERIVRLAAGASHSVALLSSGRLRAWGSDLKGQITGLESLEGVRDVACTWNGTFVRTDQGVWSQGSNSHSQLVRSSSTLPLPSPLADTTSPNPGQTRGPVGWADAVPGGAECTGLEVMRLVTGTEHVLAETADGRLHAGGWNEHGNLGLGDEVDRVRMTGVEVGARIRGVWAGCAATWVWVD